jgi:hypothetical protein
MKPLLRLLVVLKIVLVFGCLSIGCAVTQARIGETDKQCEERYGKPIETEKGQSWQVYQKADLFLLAHFHEGVCDSIMFRKVEATADGTAKELSENERELLLKANGGRNEWKTVERKGVTVILQTDDGRLQAQYDTRAHSLTIFTREAVRREKDAEKAEEEKKLKGF